MTRESYSIDCLNFCTVRRLHNHFLWGGEGRGGEEGRGRGGEGRGGEGRGGEGRGGEGRGGEGRGGEGRGGEGRGGEGRGGEGRGGEGRGRGATYELQRWNLLSNHSFCSDIQCDYSMHCTICTSLLDTCP